MVVSNHTTQKVLLPEIDAGAEGEVGWFGFCCGQRPKHIKDDKRAIRRVGTDASAANTLSTDTGGEEQEGKGETIVPERTYSLDYSSVVDGAIEEYFQRFYVFNFCIRISKSPIVKISHRKWKI